MTDIRFLGVDPGQSSGIAIVDWSSDQKKVPLQIGDCGDKVVMTDILPLWYNYEELIQEYSPDAIIFETFRLYQNKSNQKVGSDFPTVQSIGVLKYLAHKYGIPIWGQGAAMKKFYNNNSFSNLKKIGVYEKGKIHSNDALTHIFYYITFQLYHGKTPIDILAEYD